MIRSALLAMALVVAPVPMSHHPCHRSCERRRCGDDCDHRDGKETCFMLCNDVIIIPNPVPGGQQPNGVACLVPVPYHCDPKP